MNWNDNVNQRDGTKKTLERFVTENGGGEVTLTPDTPVNIEGEEPTTLEKFVKDNIPQIRTTLYQNVFNVSIDNEGYGAIILSELPINHWGDYEEIKVYIRFECGGDEYLIDFDILKPVLYQMGTTFFVKTGNYASVSTLMDIMIALDGYDGTGENGEFEITFRNHPDQSSTTSVFVFIIGC